MKIVADSEEETSSPSVVAGPTSRSAIGALVVGGDHPGLGVDVVLVVAEFPSMLSTISLASPAFRVSPSASFACPIFLMSGEPSTVSLTWDGALTFVIGY